MELSGSNPIVDSMSRGDIDLAIEPADSYLETSATEAAAGGNLKPGDIASEVFLWDFVLFLLVDSPDCGFTDELRLKSKSCSTRDEDALSKGEGTDVKRPFAGAVWY